jgi:flagellar FliL protein
MQYREDVEHLLPRIVDIMNGYLSALETEDFESPAIIVRLRSQLLRRIQVVTGIERVNDLLVMEFVLN